MKKERKERLELSDTMSDVVLKMADGNPGAINVIFELLASKVDGDSAFGGFGSILSLDSFGIYGTDIYVFYNDICNRNLTHMIAALRSVQLGLFDRKILKDACSRQDRSGKDMIPVEELYLKVKEELDNFDL